MAQYEHVPCHVVDARYLGDYKVWLEFNDGRKGVVDLADELYGEEFESLRDRVDLLPLYSITDWRPSPGKTASILHPTTFTKG